MSRERKSRRDVLIGAAGGAAVLASGAIQRIPAAQAANGDPLLLGQANNATAKTSLSVNDPVAGAEALEVIQTVISRSAIVAKARPEGGVAIVGEGGSGGVSGASLSTAAAGVTGEDRTLSSLGRGVSGHAENGWGVTANSPNGQALRVSGRATFDRSGRVTISYPNRAATVSVPGRWDTSTGFPNRPSLALAMLQTDLAGVWVRATTFDAAAGTLRIHLNRAPGSSGSPKSVEVGWFIVN